MTIGAYAGSGYNRVQAAFIQLRDKNQAILEQAAARFGDEIQSFAAAEWDTAGPSYMPSGDASKAMTQSEAKQYGDSVGLTEDEIMRVLQKAFEG